MALHEDTRRLEELLGRTPGTLLPTPASVGVIREKIKSLIGNAPVPLPCQELLRIYTTMLQRANNAAWGGKTVGPSNLSNVWGNLVKAARDLIECLQAQQANAPE